MSRPKKLRRCLCRPSSCYFKPKGVPLSSLEEVELLADELEAIKLHDLDGLSHVVSAKNMKISQATFSRILEKAHYKLATAVVEGKAIVIC